MLKLITLLLTSSMTVMAGATISPALPQIQQFFQNEPNSEFWVKLMLTLPALFTAIGAPFAGIIIDRFGRKPLLTGAVILYGLAGGSGCVLSSLTGLLIGRAFLGIAVGAIMTTSIALIADYYQGPKRNQVMGIQAAFMGYGGVIFLTLGGFLADINWRVPFLIYLSAFAVLPLVIFCLTEPNVESAQAERLAEDADAKLPVGTIALIYALTFLTMVVFYMIPVQLPFYLKSLGQVSNAQTGLAIAASTLASAIISMRYGSIKTHLSFQGVLICLYLLMGLGYVTISLAGNYALVVLGLIIAGLGLGLLLPNMNVWLNAKTPISSRGRVLGGLTTCMFLGQFCSPIVSQPIAQQIGLGVTYSVAGVVMWTLAVLLVGASVKSSFSKAA
ncbi:MAG: MFS transporter [Coleofasciculus sp. C3-bin4]|nr:MFS transporter [Coleofasciculus sp. C3-bin4]